jgi:DNA-binding NarL/FixJ family response regulator
MAKPPQIGVLIVDDHPVVRMGLRLIGDLDPCIKVIGEAASGKEAIAAARRLRPQVVLLDYRLPDAGGHEICRQIKDALSGVHVLFLSSYAADTTTTAALEAGADGYLLKENDAQKIVDAIHSVCRGGLVIDPAIARAAVTHPPGPKRAGEQALAQLSEQEQRVLAEVATGKTDKDIALAMGLEPKTVRNYLAQVYRKLNVHSRIQAVLLYQQARQ